MRGTVSLLLLLSVAACSRKRHDPDKFVSRITAGHAHACAELSTGRLACWGDDRAVHGADRAVSLPSPVEAPAEMKKPTIVASGDSTMVFDETSSKLFGRFTIETPLRARTSTFHGNSSTACALDVGGILQCTRETAAWLITVPTFAFKAFALSDTRACGITNVSEEVHCFDAEQVKGDTRIPGLEGSIAVGVGQSFACALSKGRTLSCWGKNDVGQLGNGSTIEQARPVRVVGLEGVHSFALGRSHACAILHDWTLWCWGDNTHGELADGTHEPNGVPRPIPGLFDVAEIALGDDFTCVRTNDRDHAARCWGKNDRGQAGDGTMLDRAVPSFVKF